MAVEHETITWYYVKHAQETCWVGDEGLEQTNQRR